MLYFVCNKIPFGNFASIVGEVGEVAFRSGKGSPLKINEWEARKCERKR